ncbi:type IV pilus twitching motility protein PilT [Paracoccus litorisediminis]|uniref:type IV pilus twitching motility protein PilT n=1 Tax=Paracoccus litorisediminis TaxID=2006130 RepID=UPI00372F840E
MSQMTTPPSTTSRKVSPGVQFSRKVELNRAERQAFVMEQEPQRLSMDDMRQIVMSAVMSGATDITFQSDQQLRGEAHGILYRMTRRPLAPSEVDMILLELYGGANAKTEINGMNVLDFSYELNLPDGTRQRFRVNATGILGRDERSVEITMRALPRTTPDRHFVGLAEWEIEAMSPKDGMVVVAGATGSGKSTTMAAVIRHHLESIERPVKIVDFQAPIEYTYRDVMARLAGSSSIIGQSEIGRHVRDFAQGVHSGLRRKPFIMVVGEARDFETIAASLEAALTGHLVYTTTHAGTVSNAIRRLLTTFPGNERESRAYDLISSLQFVMVQHLVPRIDIPGRVPVREYLKITDRIRDALLDQPVNAWPGIIQREMEDPALQRGPDDMRKSLRESCGFFLDKGMISEADARLIAKIRKGSP